jgi:hypothetical protein
MIDSVFCDGRYLIFLPDSTVLCAGFTLKNKTIFRGKSTFAPTPPLLPATNCGKDSRCVGTPVRHGATMKSQELKQVKRYA